MNDKKDKKISIIVIDDEQVDINQTIESCLIQSYKNIEIFVLQNKKDDSFLTDNIKNIKFFKCCDNEINKKIFAIKKCSGDLIVFLEKGNKFFNDKSLYELIEIWNEYNGLDILSFNYFYYNRVDNLFIKPTDDEQIKNNLILSKRIDFFISNLNYGLSFNFEKIYNTAFLKKVIKEVENKAFDDNGALNCFLFLKARKIATTKYVGCVLDFGLKHETPITVEDEIKSKEHLQKVKNTIQNITELIKQDTEYEKFKDFFDYFLFKKNIIYYLKEKENLVNLKTNNLFDLFCETFPFSCEIDILKKKLSSSRKNKKKESHYKYDVSVIIPIYNTEQYLEKCIESIIKNIKEKIKIQIILINDCSPGNVQELFTKKFQKYNFIRLYNNKHNMGSLFSRLKGLLYVDSPWVHFVDADDLVEENAYSFLGKTKNNIDCVFANYNILFDDRKIEKNHGFRNKIIKTPLEFYLKNTKLNRSLWNKIFRIDICVKSINEVMVTNTSVSDDHFLNIIFLSSSKRMKIVNNRIYSYYMSNEESVSASIEYKEKEKFKIKNFISSCGEKENLKLLKYIDQRELSYININNFMNQKLSNKKIRYYWNVNKYSDSTYCFIPLIKKEFNLLSEQFSKSPNVFYPLKIDKIITENLYNNESLIFFKESLWNSSPKRKFGFSLLRYIKIIFSNNPLYLMKEIYKKIFK